MNVLPVAMTLPPAGTCLLILHWEENYPMSGISGTVSSWPAAMI
ncbi:hypothetical protein BvCmsHHNP033_04453 [Escherichia coli]|nr:hypothetical protein BvCmsHHNP033_04453 [Escherichia coli]